MKDVGRSRNYFCTIQTMQDRLVFAYAATFSLVNTTYIFLLYFELFMHAPMISYETFHGL